MRLALVACALCACTEDPLQPPTGERVKYVVNSVDLPASNTEALRFFGFDLNGDGTPDNELGQVISTLGGMGADPSSNAEQLLGRGELLTLAQVQHAQPSDPDDSIALTFFAGADPSPSPCADASDSTCGRHLQGDGQFRVVASEGPAMLGERAVLPIVVGPETVTTSIPFYGHVISLELAHARVRIRAMDDAKLRGEIGAGLRRSEIETKLAPAFADYLETVIASECSARDMPPKCGCVIGDHRDWLLLFDTNPKDCAISVEEIIHNSAVVLLVSPDVTIGDEMFVSFAFGFEAVPASF